MAQSSNIGELRAEWEKGFSPIAVQIEEDRVLAVLKDKDGKYHCHRYVFFHFRVDQYWDVSVDARLVSADHALRWLVNPHALTPEELSEEFSLPVAF